MYFYGYCWDICKNVLCMFGFYKYKIEDIIFIVFFVRLIYLEYG